MMDDVLVGTGEFGNGASCMFYDKDNRIYENQFSYWINDVYLGIGMKISKACEEGVQLGRYICPRASDRVIFNWLENVLLAHVDKEELKAAIARAVEKAYESGRESKLVELHKVLGLQK